jgi:glycosidase
MRPMPWELFYDEEGRSILHLCRLLGRLRRANPQLRTGEYFFYNDWDRYQSKGVLLFSRSEGAGFSLVALNFTDANASVPFVFPRGGAYAELLHGADNFSAQAGEQRWLEVPSNYGRIWSI